MSSVRRPHGRLPNSRTGSAKTSISEAVVRPWHHTHVIRGRSKGMYQLNENNRTVWHTSRLSVRQIVQSFRAPRMHRGLRRWTAVSIAINRTSTNTVRTMVHTREL